MYAFGSLQIHGESGPLLLKGDKARGLLAYLVLRPRVAHRREMLADLLWQAAAPERVRRNLSDVLYRLQKELDADWLVADAGSITLQPTSNLWVDIWEFDRLLATQDSVNLQKAVELYTGDLLPDIYEDWILAERELRRGQYISALENLANQFEAQGKLQEALLYTRRLILAEPLHEPAYQMYIRLLGRLRRFGEAFAHYDYLCTLLRNELDARPVAETDALVVALARERDLDDAPLALEEAHPFVGRKTERAVALAAVEAMLIGNGTLLTVEGEAGMGKSRLLREVMSSARWRGATVLQSQASETPGASPYLPLMETLTPVIIKRLEAELTHEVLAALAPLHTAWSVKNDAHAIQSEQARSRFHNALRMLGEALARLKPVMLVLDEMHLATPVLWDCLRVFAQGFVGQGGLLILAYRLPAMERLHGWEILQAWEREGFSKTISLQPLNVDDVTQLLGEIKNVDPAEVSAWSGGNPFFINEWLTKPELKRPTSRNSLALRLQTLSPLAKAALESASILGEGVPYQLWIEISELPSLVLAGLADDLVRGQWLRPSTAGYVFTHGLIRSAVYAEIEASRRRELHERAAQLYSTLEPDNLRARAFHLDQAGLSTDAARAYRLVGEQELSRFAFREAQSAFERALTLTQTTESIERVELAIALAHACNATGDRNLQESILKEAVADARESDPHLLPALLIAGRFGIHTGQVAQAQSQLEMALTLAKKLKDKIRETESILLLADLSREQSHWKDARKHYDKAFRLAHKNSNLEQEARALKGIGYVLSDQGDAHESIKWIEKAIDIYRLVENRYQMALTQIGLMSSLVEISAWERLLTSTAEAIPVMEAYGDRPNVAVARHNQALAFHALGEHDKAHRTLEQNLQVFESFRSRRALGVTQYVLGEIAEHSGNIAEATTLYRNALVNLEAVKSLDGVAAAQSYLGSLYVKLEQPHDAVPLLEAALVSWREQGNNWEEHQTGAVLGLAYLVVGEKSRAEELADHAWMKLQSHKPLGEKPQQWLWALYRLFVGLNQSERASVALNAAYAELQRQAQNITDPHLRTGFFERVPDNRDIVNAYDRIEGGPRVTTVTLTHKDVPLGRTVRKDEFVTVQWTLNAPEDESIPDKAERRIYRLKRLIAEAEQQNAAPTDEDLAQALGVSRRTILRDMEFMDEESKPATRTRKK
jgi:DNA-binding SARP family transcriptional activator